MLPKFSLETENPLGTRVACGTVFSTGQGESSRLGHSLLFQEGIY